MLEPFSLAYSQSLRVAENMGETLSMNNIMPKFSAAFPQGLEPEIGSNHFLRLGVTDAEVQLAQVLLGLKTPVDQVEIRYFPNNDLWNISQGFTGARVDLALDQNGNRARLRQLIDAVDENADPIALGFGKKGLKHLPEILTRWKSILNNTTNQPS
jgi:hypothetical protein